MISLEKYLDKIQRKEKLQVITEQVHLFEHEVYTRIPGTKNSLRSDHGNTNTMTLDHSHVYAKLKGKGEELYAVNLDGSGHDGSSNIKIPELHADYLRKKGYKIKDDNILESLNYESISPNEYSLIIMENE